jgi:hypothetical protein
MQVFLNREQLTSFLVDFYEAWSILPASLAFELSFFWFYVFHIVDCVTCAFVLYVYSSTSNASAGSYASPATSFGLPSGCVHALS